MAVYPVPDLNYQLLHQYLWIFILVDISQRSIELMTLFIKVFHL